MILAGASCVPRYIDLECADGYEGPLCGKCRSFGGRKFGLRNPFVCVECGGTQIAYFVLSCVATAVVLSFSTMLNLINNRAGFQQSYYTSDIGKVGSWEGLPYWSHAQG